MDSADKRKILISPVTRIEGHAKITIQLDEAGKVLMHFFMSMNSVGLKNFAKAECILKCR